MLDRRDAGNVKYTVAVALAATVSAIAIPAEAAVRRCQPFITVTGVHPQSELEARKAALTHWLAVARGHGDGYARWQNADRRTLVCSRSPVLYRLTFPGHRSFTT